jgi:hypothetical protein
MAATLPAGDHTDPASRGLQLRARARTNSTSRTWLFRYRWRDAHVPTVLGHHPSMGLGGVSSSQTSVAAAARSHVADRGLLQERRSNCVVRSPQDDHQVVIDKSVVETRDG